MEDEAQIAAAVALAAMATASTRRRQARVPGRRGKEGWEGAVNGGTCDCKRGLSGGERRGRRWRGQEIKNDRCSPTLFILKTTAARRNKEKRSRYRPSRPYMCSYLGLGGDNVAHRLAVELQERFGLAVFEALVLLSRRVEAKHTRCGGVHGKG